MEIFRFDGKDAFGWIFKINPLFNFYNTPEDQRISIASFYMDGLALTWCQWMYNNSQLSSRSIFLHFTNKICISV